MEQEFTLDIATPMGVFLTGSFGTAVRYFLVMPTRSFDAALIDVDLVSIALIRRTRRSARRCGCVKPQIPRRLANGSLYTNVWS